MNIICDRFSVCGCMLLDRGGNMESYARAKGWHIWHGTTLGGKEHEVTLCNVCVQSHRRQLGPEHQELPDQYPIPELEIVKPDEQKEAKP